MKLGKYLSSLTKPELDEIEKICNFTEDEEQIFKCISKGYTLRQIEIKCNMSESTVIRRVSRIDWKINKAKEMMEVKKDIPVCEKYNLTIEEASAYFNIGKDRMREIENENRNELVLVIGRKNLIKRKKMEEYLDRTMVL